MAWSPEVPAVCLCSAGPLYSPPVRVAGCGGKASFSKFLLNNCTWVSYALFTMPECTTHTVTCSLKWVPVINIRCLWYMQQVKSFRPMHQKLPEVRFLFLLFTVVKWANCTHLPLNNAVNYWLVMFMKCFKSRSMQCSCIFLFITGKNKLQIRWNRYYECFFRVTDNFI